MSDTDLTQLIELGEVSIKDLTPDQIFSLTQSMRLRLVEKLAKDIPTDAKDGGLFLTALNDLDKQIISRSKLELESERNRTDQETKAVIAQALLNRANENTNVANASIPSLPTGYSYLPVPGETDVKPVQLEYDQIMSRD